MSDSGHLHHSIDYVEINSTDLTQTRAFYEAAFGWGFNEYGPDYLGIQKTGGGEAGGIRKVDAVASGGGVLVILYSDDLEATCAAVEAAGGGIIAPIFSFPGGRRFEFTDPSGNHLAVWSSK